MSLDYKKAGVDIAKGEQLVNWLKSNPQKSPPHAQRLLSGIGGFAALFRGDFPQMQKPVLVSATDGVGTKLKMAVHFQDYSRIGQDLVAMCVNDLICCGAQPLFFLDYFACGSLNLPLAQEFLQGLQRACSEGDCALIGGETAEMPGVYSAEDFDCAGFAVGVVDEAKILQAKNVEAGDLLVGLASSGFHSNGFSLLREVFSDDLEDWREQLLMPTKLYVKPLQQLREKFALKSVAHITGGGLDNILRALPKTMGVTLQPWKIPQAFLEVKQRRQMSWADLLITLNCGMGLAVVVSEEESSALLAECQQMGLGAQIWGKVTPGEHVWQVNEKELAEVNS